MKQYRRLETLFVLFIAAYILIGNGTWIWNQSEIYPFFSWDLFSYIPEEAGDYGVRITFVDGQPLPSPVYFEYATALVSDPHSTNAWAKIQDFRHALDAGDTIAAERAQAQFEELFLTLQAQYEVVQRTFRPLDRWHNGAFSNERLVATLLTGQK